MVGERIYRIEVTIGLEANAASLSLERESFSDMGPTCSNPACPWGYPIQKRHYPGIFEFDEGIVYDFVSGVGPILAKESVGADLAKHCSGLVSEPIITKRYKKSLPELRELRFLLDIPLNAQRSTVRISSSCDVCGRVSFDAAGVETQEHEEKQDDEWVVVPHKNREPGKGIIVLASEVNGLDFFTYNKRYNLCTERAKRYIEDKGWSNVYFLEYGEIIDG